jgi:hypothetical protein
VTVSPKKPQATVLGAVLMCARAASGVFVIIVGTLEWRKFADALVIDDKLGDSLDDQQAMAVTGVVLGVYGIAMLLYLALALFVFFGHNWARVVAMAFATISIVTAFIDYWNNGVEITLRTTLLSLTLDILILLALSSTAARHYARRPRGTSLKRAPRRREPREKHTPSTPPAALGTRGLGS